MATQEVRPFEVISPLGTDVLLFRRMKVVERLGRPFQIDLDLLSEDEQISPTDLLGQSTSVRVALPKGDPRYFNGLVTQFALVGRHLGPDHRYLAAYKATLRPWLWFLTLTTDCKIFQEKTVPDIIKEVFSDNGYTDFEDKLSGDYGTWNYCVQYRESDFNFVSRLMETEGIYYYFKHEEGKHQLVLCDAYGAHEAYPQYEEIPYYPPGHEDQRIRDHIVDVRTFQQVRSGACALNEYDFRKPKANLEVTSSDPKDHEKADAEVYDYPGGFLEKEGDEVYSPARLEQIVRARLEELQSDFEYVEGKAVAMGVACGALFSLTRFPRQDQNREYLLVSTEHEMHTTAYESIEVRAEGPWERYECSFTAIPSKTPYRSPPTTRKPMIRGPQTAVVVGKSGEEIWTDKYGRVKVQFHWDRYGTSDENSSCWVRVAQVWAGKGWGAIQIPRIGQEVIVDFLEGDPDRPIITGRVYNADQTVPYPLPGKQVVSGLKSNSTKGGGGYNEYVMDDTKGNELIREHGQYDKDSTIENDLREHVLNDRSRDVTNNETITIGVDRTKQVGQNETLIVGQDRTRNVGKNETVTVGMMRTHTVGVNEAITIGAAQEVTVGAARTVTVGASQTISVGANVSESVGKNRSEDVGDNRTANVGKNDALTVGKNLSVDAGDEILLKTGQASITMKKDGTILIKGNKITIDAKQKIEEKALQISSEAKTKNLTKGAMVNVEASAMNTVKGALVKIN